MIIKLIFQNGGCRHLGFCRSEIWRQQKSRLTRIYLHTKFGEDILKGGQVMAIYVFSKWRSAAILNFQGSETWRYFCFQDIRFSLWAKFCVNTRNNDLWPLKWIFKMAAAAILDFAGSEIWRQDQSRLTVSITVPNWVKISWRAAELWWFMCFQNGGRPPSWIFTEVKFEGISVSRTSVFLPEPNFV